jgi:hypothetical protein
MIGRRAVGAITAGIAISAAGVLTTIQQPTPAPLTVILQSVDGSAVTCPAQSQTFDLVNGRSTLTVIGLACVSDSIFKNGFEVRP